MTPKPLRRASRWPGRALLTLLLSLLLAEGPPARAQDDLEDVLGGIGQGQTADPDEVPAEQRAGEGTIRGRVFNADTGLAVQGATVIVAPPGAGQAEQRVVVSDIDGAFEIPSLPAGNYDVTFIKSGFRLSSMKNFQVESGTVKQADFPMPPLAATESGEVLDLEAFVVEASTVEEMMTSLELRMDSDAQLNIMSAEDLSKFASGDVADALKRVSGVNVVEGQFAIIRGLEERYSSTLYNGAVVPSPDPLRQSVQLDLFQSDIVSNLVVTKNFLAQQPGNSSGGSINILTTAFPDVGGEEGDTFEIKLSGQAGFNDNARDRFLRYNDQSPVGVFEDGWDTVNTDWAVSAGGRKTLLDRLLRFKVVGAREVNHKRSKGFQQTLEPRIRNLFRGDSDFTSLPVQSGGLGLGQLDLQGGRFNLDQSDRDRQYMGYSTLGLDIDPEGEHRLDGSIFYTHKWVETVQKFSDGFLPGVDYSEIRRDDQNFDEISSASFANQATSTSWLTDVARDRFEDPARGHQYWTALEQSRSFRTERSLFLTQLNGTHDFERFLKGLDISWVMNWAKTKQDEQANGARLFFVPEDLFQPAAPEFPVPVETLGPGQWAIRDDLVDSFTDIEERSRFGRIDGSYELEPLDFLRVRLSAGGWYEKAKRDVESRFLDEPSVGSPFECRESGICQADSTGNFVVLGDTQGEAGDNIPRALLRRDEELETRVGGKEGFFGDRDTFVDAERKVWAAAMESKLTFWDRLDLIGGLRIEKIEITTEVDARRIPPFERFGVEDIFPSRYLFFDRRDNDVTRTEGQFEPPYNDQLLGLNLVPDPVTGFVDVVESDYPSLLNADIDETKYLPSASLAYRPMQGVTWRFAFSKTVARPSFRELGYYVTVSPGTDDREIGNPRLRLSDVWSYDTRLEYVYGEGDLFAFSAFYKNIEDPIEQITVANPIDLSSDTLYRTWFNNPNQADLWGIEVEARKNLGFLDYFWKDRPIFAYFEIGGNYTYIDAEVKRTEAQRVRAEGFFGVLPEDVEFRRNLKSKRQLFGQPEWIANADITFDQPDWGTRVTLAFFAIDEVLDAAGSATVTPSGAVLNYTVDRFVDSFHTLDLIFSQRIWGGLVFKGRIKNLTDSKRGIVYDRKQTRQNYYERRLKSGPDFKFGLTYTLRF